MTYKRLNPLSTEDAESSGDGSKTTDEWSLSDSTLLSFPWIVSPLLAHIKAQSGNHSDLTGGKKQELEDISKLIISQTKRIFFYEDIQEEMKKDFSFRQDERDGLTTILPSMPLLGASMTGLNISDKKPQPLQLYAHVTWDADPRRQEQCLRLYVQALQRLMTVNYKHLFIHCEDESPHLSFTVQDFNYYISADPYEMLRSFYIYLHIKQSPLLLPLLLVVMHWARKRYMTGSARDSFLAVEDLGVLFIKFCEHSKFVKEVCFFFSFSAKHLSR